MIQNKAIQDWEIFVANGNKYFETSKKMVGGTKRKFNPEIIYNIIAMSIENNLVGTLMRHGTMPESHVLGDMVDEISRLKDVGELGEKIKKMDAFQEICSIEHYNRKPVSFEDLEEMIDTAGQVKVLTEELTV